MNQRPTLFRYEVWGFTNWARFLTDYAVVEFQFHEVSGGTEVQWTYSFHKRSWLMTPVVSWVVQNDFAEPATSAGIVIVAEPGGNVGEPLVVSDVFDDAAGTSRIKTK